MWFRRHLPFLRQVLKLAMTAFGGPQGHLVMMKKLFVDKRHDISEDELLDYNSFTQLLPGPSSSQTIMLVGHKRGGPILAILTMMVWVLPACTLMGLISFLVYYWSINKEDILAIFEFLQPISIGFIAYAAYLYTKQYINNTITSIIAVITILITITFINPWTFPALIIAGGIATNFSSKRIPDKGKHKRKKIQWQILLVFFGVFILLGTLSTFAMRLHWPSMRAFGLAENFYRFGSIVFGGGQVLLPMLLYQFVYRPKYMGLAPLISSQQIITGYGLVNSIPGPVYSLAAYVGGMILAPMGWQWQLLGVIIGGIFIFLPGMLLILFLYPIYQNLQYHVIIFRALEGIRAVITGILWASTIVLWMKTIHASLTLGMISMGIYILCIILAISTFALLRYNKASPQIIVISALILGIILYYVPLL